ncbi:MAG: hypothetical protein WC742_15055, partial [Gallionellaceae bacterium]
PANSWSIKSGEGVLCVAVMFTPFKVMAVSRQLTVYTKFLTPSKAQNAGRPTSSSYDLTT